MTTKNEYIDLGEWLEKKIGPFTFADFARNARDTLELSQVEMAKLMGVSKSTLCDIEKGRQLVSPALAAKFAKKCKHSIKVAVTASLQDQLRKAKLDYEVRIA